MTDGLGNERESTETLVVKVGGSLFDLPELADRLWQLADLLNRPMCIIPGGGGLVQELRRLDGIHHWPSETSHVLALQAMSLTAKLVARCDARFELLTALPSIEEKPRSRIQVLDVTHLPGLDRIPASWDVTSDSIAAWIALQLGKKDLLLVRSLDLPDPVPSIEAAAEAGLVDSYFPRVASQLWQISWINLRRPELRIQKWVKQPIDDEQTRLRTSQHNGS